MSHQRIGACFRGTQSSKNNDCNHVNLAAASTKALYSDYVDDRATVCCFREDQETRLGPK